MKINLVIGEELLEKVLENEAAFDLDRAFDEIKTYISSNEETIRERLAKGEDVFHFSAGSRRYTLYLLEDGDEVLFEVVGLTVELKRDKGEERSIEELMKSPLSELTISEFRKLKRYVRMDEAVPDDTEKSVKGIQKIVLPSHMRAEHIKAIESIGHDGHDYKKTEATLIEITKKMLEHFGKEEKK